MGRYAVENVKFKDLYENTIDAFASSCASRVETDLAGDENYVELRLLHRSVYTFLRMTFLSL